MADDRWRDDDRGNNRNRGYGEGRDRDDPRQGGGYRRDNTDYGRGGRSDPGRYGQDYGNDRPGRNGPGGYGPGGYGGQQRDPYPGGNRDGDYDRGGQDRGGNRDFWDRASDEVSSWFGRGPRGGTDRDNTGRGPKGYTRSDERIADDVNERLTQDHILDASDMEVEVANGEVTLSGTVESRETKRRAEDIADSVSGVTHVQNNLRVKSRDEDDNDGGDDDEEESDDDGGDNANRGRGRSR